MAAAAAAVTERRPEGARESAAAAERGGARARGLGLGIPGRKEAAGEARALIARALESSGRVYLANGSRVVPAEEGGDARGDRGAVRCLEGPPESLPSGTCGMVPHVGGVAWVDGDKRLFLLRR